MPPEVMLTPCKCLAEPLEMMAPNGKALSSGAVTARIELHFKPKAKNTEAEVKPWRS